MLIPDRVAIVTGGASGLGRATAQALLERGGRVVILDRKRPAVPIEAEHLFVPTDITQDSEVQHAMQAAMDAFGRVDICVNCAGIVQGAPVLGENGPFPMELFRRTIEVNLTGTFLVLSRAAEQMAKNQPGADGERGIIINTASIAALDASSSAAYAASKGGVVSLTLTVARDLAAYGIRVNAIAPGFMETDMFAELPPAWTDALIAKAEFPKRLGRPEEFGSLVCHIVENRFMNASVIRFDAGARV